MNKKGCLTIIVLFLFLTINIPVFAVENSDESPLEFQLNNPYFIPNPITKDCIGATLLRMGNNEKDGQYSTIGYIYTLNPDNTKYGIVSAKSTELNGKE